MSEQSVNVEYVKLSRLTSVILFILTLGVGLPLIWLSVWITARSWPRTLSFTGIELRGGKFIRWDECERLVEVVTVMRPVTVTRFDLHTSRGVVKLPVERMVHGNAVMDYVVSHVPQDALGDPQE